MGKAKDGSECFTRQNKSGGSYVTCEGKQKSGKSAAKPAAKPKAKPKVDWNRSDTARGKARRAAAARKLTTRPAAAGRIQTGSLNPGSVITDFDTSGFVAEAPGVVGMTSSMTPLGQATFDALLGTGADVSSMISAAVASYDPGKMIDLNRESAPENANTNDLVKPPGFKKGEKFRFNYDVGYSSHVSPYARTAIFTPSKFITDKEGVSLKKYTQKQMKDPKYKRYYEKNYLKSELPQREDLMKYAVYYLHATPESKSYKESYQMRDDIFSRRRFVVDFKKKQILNIG